MSVKGESTVTTTFVLFVCFVFVFICLRVAFFSLGVDWGGLRREWVELLCKALFSHESGFFTRFNADDPQALVGVRLLSSGYIGVCQLAEKNDRFTSFSNSCLTTRS